MPITFVGSDIEQSNNGSNLTLTIPSHATNDFGIIFGYADEDGGGTAVQAVTTATGWTTLTNTLDTVGRGIGTYLFYKKFTSASETNPVMTNDLTEEWSTSLHVFRGVDRTTPFDASFVHDAGTNDTTPNCAAITTVTANAAVVLYHASTHNDITVSGIPATPSGLTEGGVILPVDWPFSGQFCAHKVDVGAAATITPTDWTHTSDPTNVAEWVVYTLALRPAAIGHPLLGPLGGPIG